MDGKNIYCIKNEANWKSFKDKCPRSWNRYIEKYDFRKDKNAYNHLDQNSRIAKYFAMQYVHYNKI